MRHHLTASVVASDHVQLAMPAGGEDDAIAFYEGILGIPHVPKPPHLAVRGGCWFERGDLKVHLGVDPGNTAAPGFYQRLGFRPVTGPPGARWYGILLA